MNTQSRSDSKIVTADMLSGLPEPVQRYMTYTGVVGKPWVNTVRLKYSGTFRLGADRPWMPLRAAQVYTTNPPGFLWKARFKLFGLPLMSGRDSFQDGRGHMFGKLAGLITLFDAQDDKLLQGGMMRYLNEMTWFPVAYLGENITWKAVNDNAADVSFHDHGKTVSARMYFDDVGRPLSFVAQRYRENKGSYTLDTWATPFTEFVPAAGLNLPVAGLGEWQLPEGDLAYIKIHLTEIVYNEPIETF